MFEAKRNFLRIIEKLKLLNCILDYLDFFFFRFSLIPNPANEVTTYCILNLMLQYLNIFIIFRNGKLILKFYITLDKMM